MIPEPHNRYTIIANVRACSIPVFVRIITIDQPVAEHDDTPDQEKDKKKRGICEIVEDENNR